MDQTKREGNWTATEAAENAKQYGDKPPIVTKSDALHDAPPNTTTIKGERVTAFVTAYAHGLEHNSPRSPAEYRELQFLLGVTDVDPNEPTEERLEAQRIAEQRRAELAEPVKETA